MAISLKDRLFQPQPIEMAVLFSPRDAAGRGCEDRGGVVGSAYCGIFVNHLRTKTWNMELSLEVKMDGLA